MPNELDVPHWATSMIRNYRAEAKLPERVTDRMIFARLQETQGMEQDDILECIRDLIAETENA